MYRCAKQSSESSSNKQSAKVDELHLTPLELIDRIAALIHHRQEMRFYPPLRTCTIESPRV